MRRLVPQVSTLAVALVILAVGLMPASGNAQSRPASINSLQTITSAPTAEQRERLRAFATYYGQALAGRDLVAVGEARDALIRPLTAPQASDVFLDNYSKTLLSQLEPIISDQDNFLGSMNAMQIVGRMPYIGALNVALDHCDPDEEPRMVIRIWAARGVQTILSQSKEEVIRNKDRLGAIRALRYAAADEDQWPALSHQFQAIASTDLTRTNENMAEAFEAVVDNLAEQQEASSLMRALRRAMVALRQQFLDARGEEQREHGKRVIKALVKLLRVADLHWESAQDDPEHRKTYLAVVGAAERTISSIDRQSVAVISRQTLKFEESYQERDKDTYSSEVAKVEQITSQPPYK